MNFRSIQFSILFSVFILPVYSSAQQNVELINSGEILNTGDVYNSLGHYNKAEALYLKVGRNDTNYAEILRDLAYTYSLDNEDSLCLSVARRGMALESVYKADFYIYQGIALKNLEKFDTAIKTFDEGIRLYPYKYIMQYQKGMTYFKMKKYPEAELCFQNAILLNPYHANSHFQLGKCCAEQGHVVPAVLSWQYFLMIENNTERAQKVVSYLEDLYTGENQPDPDFQMTAHEAGDDCFNDITEVINSKAAFAPGYKNKTIIELKMVKMFQAILEKLHYDSGTDNFWMENYVPFFVELQKKNFLVPYESQTLYAVSGDNPTVGKSVKKNKKKIHAFAIWAGDYIDKHSKHPARNSFAKEDNVQITFFDNHIINGIGIINDAGIENGKWKYYYLRSGHPYSEGNFVNGKRDGDWVWYFENGVVKERSTFEKGERTGPSKEYYDNGLLSTECTYEHGLLQGKFIAYDVSGVKSQEANMNAGKLNGAAIIYYEDGTIKAEMTYLLGLLSGELVVNNVDGKLTKKLNYKVDLRNGSSKEYYANGTVESEGEYKNDAAFGPWKSYFDNGKVYREGLYKDKGLRNGIWNEYFRNGELSIKANYLNGKLNGLSSYYDTDGKLYAEKKFLENKLKAEKFFNKDGSVLADFQIENDIEVTEYYPNGERSAKGMYYAGERTGDWKLYDENGSWLSAKAHYEYGDLNGTRTEYYENGEENSELDFRNGNRNGYLKVFYIDGTLQSEGWYVDGDKQGDWYDYNQRGLVQSHRYYINGNLYGFQEYYDEKGKKDEEMYFRNNEIWNRTRFDSTGTVIYKYVSDNGNGVYDFKYANGQTLIKQTYKGGILNGITERYLMNGTKTVETNFINGDQHGVRKEYFDEDGKLASEANYAYNDRNGITTVYWENGAKRSEEHFIDGDLYGEQKYYYSNGNLMKEGTWEAGSVNGELKLYAEDGTLEFIRYYKDGMVLGYSYFDKDGKPVAMIPFEKASGKFTAYYQNGNKSMEGEYVNGRFEGRVIEYFANGKIAEDENYKNGDFEGVEKYYYPNDSLKKELHYKGDEEDGKSIYYYDNGKVEHSEFHLLGDNFGTWIYYNKDGVELKREVYYDDILQNSILSVPTPPIKPTSKPKTK